MALLEDNFQNHNVHQVVSQLREALKEAENKASDYPAIDYLDGLRQAISYIDQRLELASPVLTSAGRLSNLEKSAQATLNELNQYNSNSNAGHLTNASNQVDAALNQARLLISIDSPEGGVKASEAVSFKELAENVIAELRQKNNELVEIADKVSGSLQVSENRVNELDGELDSLNEKISTKLNEIDKSLSEKESERENIFEENQENIKSRYEEVESEFKETAKQIVDELTSKKKEAEKIVQLVGNIGLTGNYRGIAERERSSANLMRWIALGCFSAMFFVIAVTLIFAARNGFDPWLTAFRFTAGLILIIPATYAARESSRHRAIEERNKRTELELASIDAYLENLPDDAKHKIKEALSNSFFGQSLDNNGDVNAEPVSSRSLIILLKDAISALGRK